MDSFFSNPHLEGLFPRDKVSPTLSLLLTEHKGDEHAVVAMASALRNGWLDIRELSTQKDGVPALAHWMRGFDPLRSSLNHNYQWPVKGNEGWAKVGPKEGPIASFSAPGTKPDWSMRAEWLVGLCISLSPEGLAPLRWAPEGDDRPRIGMLSMAVERGWAGVVSQLTRVPDALCAKEIEALCMPTPRRYTGMKGPVGKALAGSNTYSPLLHHALEEDAGVARVLMEHGVSPLHRDDLGVPAWYRASDVKTLRLALSFMPSAQSVFSERVLPIAYWSKSQSSAEVGSNMNVLRRWLESQTTDKKKRELALQSAARGMTDCGVTALKYHLKEFGARPSSTWKDEQGKEWGLATAALAWLAHTPLLQDSQEHTFEGAASLAWSLSRGDLDKLPQVWPEVSNSDALWFLTTRWTRGRNVWNKKGKRVPEVDPQKVCAWTRTLTNSCRNLLVLPSFLPKDPSVRGNALHHAWRGLGYLEGSEPEEVIQIREEILEAAREIKCWKVSGPLVRFSLDLALSCAKRENVSEASRWMGWGLRLLGSLPAQEMLPEEWSKKNPSLVILAKKLFENLDPNSNYSSTSFQSLGPVRKIILQVEELLNTHAVEPAAPLPSLSDWESHPVLHVAAKRLRPAFWMAQWPGPSSSGPRSRL